MPSFLNGALTLSGARDFAIVPGQGSDLPSGIVEQHIADVGAVRERVVGVVDGPSLGGTGGGIDGDPKGLDADAASHAAPNLRPHLAICLSVQAGCNHTGND